MLTLNAGWNDVVQKSVTTKKVRSDKVALLCIRGDTRDIYLDVNDLKDTSFHGTILKHVDSAYIDLDKNPGLRGPPLLATILLVEMRILPLISD